MSSSTIAREALLAAVQAAGVELVRAELSDLAAVSEYVGAVGIAAKLELSRRDREQAHEGYRRALLEAELTLGNGRC